MSDETTVVGCRYCGSPIVQHMDADLVTECDDIGACCARVAERDGTVTEENGMRYLLRHGNLRVPCSRYGHDTRDCAFVAWELHKIHVYHDVSEADTLVGLDDCMSLVVNDSDDVSRVIVNDGHAVGIDPFYVLPADGLTRGLVDVWGNGFADEETGEGDGPLGHAFRVGRAIVKTDERGFTTTTLCLRERDAVAEMADMARELEEMRREADLDRLRNAYDRAVVLADGEAVDACGLLLDAVDEFLRGEGDAS
jgi:hypothetical protein